MSEVIRIKKGLNIKLKGAAGKRTDSLDFPSYTAVKPTDFPQLTPKLKLKEGDTVRTGEALFFGECFQLVDKVS